MTSLSKYNNRNYRAAFRIEIRPVIFIKHIRKI